MLVVFEYQEIFIWAGLTMHLCIMVTNILQPTLESYKMSQFSVFPNSLKLYLLLCLTFNFYFKKDVSSLFLFLIIFPYLIFIKSLHHLVEGFELGNQKILQRQLPRLMTNLQGLYEEK